VALEGMTLLLALRRLWLGLKRVASRAWGPRVVWGWVDGDAGFLRDTRVSNQCVIFDRDRLRLGDHVFVGHFAILDASHGLTIEEGCQIGFFTGLFTHSSHVAIRLYGRDYARSPSKKAYFEAAVHVGAYSFVGAHAIVLPGSRIGKGSLVAAYSQVDGEFPDFAVLAGQPAKVVGDTRKMDQRWLERHPELRPSYEAWAGGSA
jgi:acetyltransferase-like isoleucine patch superfamily enzyme